MRWLCVLLVMTLPAEGTLKVKTCTSYGWAVTTKYYQGRSDVRRNEPIGAKGFQLQLMQDAFNNKDLSQYSRAGRCYADQHVDKTEMDCDSAQTFFQTAFGAAMTDDLEDRLPDFQAVDRSGFERLWHKNLWRDMVDDLPKDRNGDSHFISTFKVDKNALQEEGQELNHMMKQQFWYDKLLFTHSNKPVMYPTRWNELVARTSRVVQFPQPTLEYEDLKLYRFRDDGSDKHVCRDLDALLRSNVDVFLKDRPRCDGTCDREQLFTCQTNQVSYTAGTLCTCWDTINCQCIQDFVYSWEFLYCRADRERIPECRPCPPRSPPATQITSDEARAACTGDEWRLCYCEADGEDQLWCEKTPYDDTDKQRYMDMDKGLPWYLIAGLVVTGLVLLCWMYWLVSQVTQKSHKQVVQPPAAQARSLQAGGATRVNM